ncbi:tRNA (adenosine(37)-N6)-threonylcarbamoyltransferase complex dimerization subunit type 1 TsaB [Aureisphaera galaxeae]|uniref:tRNA (adenosine(37)-N6)-threonylcarbamoyltransferase complex dimerization subunit type 1 TsaB n=1 Tax=Aureisphaera galaxeae TaxID=1538023 RepID=UPI002350EA1D|nr:tRNA (adenosine(37)-N6)-threonylcarbamoyltransferase complex dimerization subunit type 1 TsaB [Aureisphaera galaxeae]MDC8005783.1 tRNA (adenosine(37)-N6)-threonylcarbamoyltransferase complex dimerization subunit type 1 TsaB [Aureisphaera galaxeae]
MANILCIETATTNCSVALSVNGSVISLKEDNTKGYSHAEKLHVFIEEVLAEGGMEKKNLDAVAVSKGPGSYTGLRIGVSAAKGLCFALDIPLLSVATLESLMSQSTVEAMFYIPMLDARRMEVYSAVFDTDKNQIRETQAQILDEHSFEQYLASGKVAFLGSGVEKFKNICTHSNAHFDVDALPSAQQIAAIANAKYQKGDFEDVAYFEPYYLKDFIVGK